MEFDMDHKFSEILRFPHKFQLRRVIRTRAGKEGVLPVAKAIYDTHLAPLGNFRAAVHFFLDVCYTVDRVKCEVIGQTAPTDVSNDVQQVIGAEILKGTSWDDTDVNWLEDNVNTFKSQNSVLTSWGATKLWVLLSNMRHFSSSRTIAMQRIPVSDEIIREAEAGYDVTEAHIRDMMDGLMELRRYGVKSSFTRRGFLQGSQAWVMWDSRDVAAALSTPRKGLVSTVALATDVNQIKDLRFEKAVRHNTDSTGIHLPFPASFMWMMRTDGEFEISPGLGSILVRDIFEKHNSQLVYQAMRLQLVYHLYDLVVPVAKLAMLPSAHTPKLGIVKKLATALHLAKKDPVVDLMLPRLRLLEDHAGLAEATEQEIEKAATDTRTRAVRKHDVTDFIRPLPKGHRPSPQARKRAWEAFGIELGENETYVRSHKRGKGDEITAHEAKRIQLV